VDFFYGSVSPVCCSFDEPLSLLELGTCRCEEESRSPFSAELPSTPPPASLIFCRCITLPPFLPFVPASVSDGDASFNGDADLGADFY